MNFYLFFLTQHPIKLRQLRRRSGNRIAKEDNRLRIFVKYCSKPIGTEGWSNYALSTLCLAVFFKRGIHSL